MNRKYKILIAVLFFCIAFFESKAQEKIQWYGFEQALAYNSQSWTPKKYFVDVYTDWCGWCKRMDVTSFQDPEVIKIMNRYFISAKLDAERKDSVFLNGRYFVNKNPQGQRSSHELAQVLLEGKMSYPSFVIIDETGKSLQILKGYLDAENIKTVLVYFGSNAYKSMGWDEFKTKFKAGEIEY